MSGTCKAIMAGRDYKDLVIEPAVADAIEAERYLVAYRLLLGVTLQQLHDLKIEAERLASAHRRVRDEYRDFRAAIMRASLHETDA